jgi:hypothetical protein
MKKKIPCRVIDSVLSEEHAGEPSCRDSFEVENIIRIFCEILYSSESDKRGVQPVSYVKRQGWLEILPDKIWQGEFLDFRF